MSFVTRVVFLVILAGIVLAQSLPPALGIQLSNPLYPDWDVRFPLTVAQCEPVFIFYNNRRSDRFGGVELFANVDLGATPFLFIGYIPLGVGYIEWICNIPAGYSFWAGSTNIYPVVVQPGSLSSCLHDITTTYQYVVYSTVSFQSYTAGPPTPLKSFVAPIIATSTVPFPAGSFPTITVNPDLIVAPPTPTPPPPIPSPRITSSTLASTTPSSHSTSSTPSTSSRTSSTPAIAGGVIGGIILAVLVGVVLLRMRQRRTPPFNVGDLPIASSPTVVAPRPTGMPATNSEIASTTEQVDGSVLRNRAGSIAPMPDTQMIRSQYPQLTSQTHASMYPQLGLPTTPDSNAHRREASLHPDDTNVPGAPTQPASGPGAGSEDASSAIVAAFTSFTRLQPEQMRTLYPVLGTIMATQQPSERMRNVSAPGAPPSYSD